MNKKILEKEKNKKIEDYRAILDGKIYFKYLGTEATIVCEQGETKN